MIIRIISGYLLWVGLVACSSSLERKGVPVMGGISSQGECSTAGMYKDLDAYHQFGLDGYMVEIPITIDLFTEGSDFRYYERHAVDTLNQVFMQRQIPYSLAFNMENPRNVPLRKVNIEHYFTDVSGILLRTNNYPPQKIVFMGEFLNSKVVGNKLKPYIELLKKEFEAFQGDIVFAAFSHQLNEDFDWQTPDLVGIRYVEPPDLDYRSHFRKLNRSLSLQFLNHEKPALIVQSNLLGEEKLNLFKNELRFWDAEVDLRGIVLNGILCNLTLTDHESYFALGEDAAFKKYLKSYVD